MASNYVILPYSSDMKLYGNLKQKVCSNNSCALDTTEIKFKCHYGNNRNKDHNSSNQWATPIDKIGMPVSWCYTLTLGGNTFSEICGSSYSDHTTQVLMYYISHACMSTCISSKRLWEQEFLTYLFS
jgi:hypothetical protein